MAVSIELSRSFLYQLCMAADKGENVAKQAAMLKLHASTMGMKAANEAVQIFGGYGYMEGNKVARYYRDAKVFKIGGNTSEVMKQLIAGEVIREFSEKRGK